MEKVFSQKRYPEAIKKYQHLYDQLSYLSVDWVEAEKILNNLYRKDEFRKELQRDNLRRLEDPNQWTFKTGGTRRLYTPISNLHEKLRDVLRYNGKPLVGLDIKSSIPFFSLTLFIKQVYEEQEVEKLILAISKSLNSKAKWKDNQGTSRRPLVMLAIFHDTQNNFSDIGEFIGLVKTGFYEGLMEVFNVRDYKVVKSIVLELFNSPSTFDTKHREAFANRFPNVMKAIDLVNTGYRKTKNGKGKAKWKSGDQVCTFAHVTQQLEARFLLDTVCKAIEEDHPEVPMLTLHDCIFTTQNHIALVKSYMERHAVEFMGFAPGIEVK